MATIHLPPDFKEFFQLLNSHKVLYLVIGGYAVAYHGYPRATGDIDIWIATVPDISEEILNNPEKDYTKLLLSAEYLELGYKQIQIIQKELNKN